MSVKSREVNLIWAALDPSDKTSKAKPIHKVEIKHTVLYILQPSVILQLQIINVAMRSFTRDKIRWACIINGATTLCYHSTRLPQYLIWTAFPSACMGDVRCRTPLFSSMSGIKPLGQRNTHTVMSMSLCDIIKKNLYELSAGGHQLWYWFVQCELQDFIPTQYLQLVKVLVISYLNHPLVQGRNKSLHTRPCGFPGPVD